MPGRVDNITQQPRPPHLPWHAFSHTEPAIGYVSYYLCDELARWPVRAVTRIKDNKSDPNLETGTYGLFSTCEQKMRSGIVASAPRYLFFVTRPRNAGRQVTGMYELGWWAPGSLHQRIRDFALAARRMRFIDPVPVEWLPGDLAREISGKWRLFKRLGPQHTATLAEYVASQPDKTAEYLQEVERVERINRFHSGYRYPTWRREDAWTWADALRYLKPAAFDPTAPKIRNSSPTGWWRCSQCGEATENAALLKACPACHELDTLRPLAAHELSEEA
jgi:hypothetical protein